LKLFRLIYEYKKFQNNMKESILFIKLPPSLRHLPLHSSVTMPASLLLHEAKSARKADEILIKK
ncbi:MAG: hypothetical protein K2K75_05415, partial [Muribaculaceae bacterium]|nr:hypothetical protein [Muribaculaceae bacterium]